jgi:hypothetical protein
VTRRDYRQENHPTPFFSFFPIPHPLSCSAKGGTGGKLYTRFRSTAAFITAETSFLPLVVDSLAVSGHGSLLEGLGKSGVSVASASDVLGGSTVLESEGTLGDHLTGVGADNVHTEDTVGLGVSEELDETVGVGVGLGAGVGAEGERPGLVLDAGLLELGLVLADPGDLGVSVHDAGDGAVVDVAVVLGDVLDGGDSLLLSLVGKHGAECAVTDDANVRDLGAVLLVDHEAATVVGLKTDLLEAETGGVGATTDGDEADVSIELEIDMSVWSLKHISTQMNLQSRACRPWQPQAQA